ncbi:hypothetical protein GCM10028799_79910 [Kribbella italica]
MGLRSFPGLADGNALDIRDPQHPHNPKPVLIDPIRKSHLPRAVRASARSDRPISLQEVTEPCAHAYFRH